MGVVQGRKNQSSGTIAKKREDSIIFNEGARPSIFELELPLSNIYVNHSNYSFELRKYFFSNRCHSREVLVQK